MITMLSDTVWIEASLDALPGVGAMMPRKLATGCILLKLSQVAPGVTSIMSSALSTLLLIMYSPVRDAYGDGRILKRLFVSSGCDGYFFECRLFDCLCTRRTLKSQQRGTAKGAQNREFRPRPTVAGACFWIRIHVHVTPGVRHI